MPEAKSILRNFASPMDIVIARSNFASASQTKPNFDSLIDQPLSLLAHYDEEDLINLSATPLRPNANDLLTGNHTVQPTVIRIGDDMTPGSHQIHQDFRYAKYFNICIKIGYVK